MILKLNDPAALGLGRHRRPANTSGDRHEAWTYEAGIRRLAHVGTVQYGAWDQPGDPFHLENVVVIGRVPQPGETAWGDMHQVVREGGGMEYLWLNCTGAWLCNDTGDSINRVRCGEGWARDAATGSIVVDDDQAGPPVSAGSIGVQGATLLYQPGTTGAADQRVTKV